MIVHIAAESRFYVKLSTDVLRRPDLSRAAKGLWAELLTHSSTWEIRTRRIQETGPEGRDKIRGLLRELEGAGLAELRVRQGGGSEWFVYSEPREPENPVLGDPESLKTRAPENPETLKIRALKYRPSKEEVEIKGSRSKNDSDFGGPDRKEVAAVFSMSGGTEEQAAEFWNYNEGLAWMRGGSRIQKWQTFVKPWIDRDATRASDTKRRFAPDRTPHDEFEARL